MVAAHWMEKFSGCPWTRAGPMLAIREMWNTWESYIAPARVPETQDWKSRNPKDWQAGNPLPACTQLKAGRHIRNCGQDWQARAPFPCRWPSLSFPVRCLGESQERNLPRAVPLILVGSRPEQEEGELSTLPRPPFLACCQVIGARPKAHWDWKPDRLPLQWPSVGS